MKAIRCTPRGLQFIIRPTTCDVFMNGCCRIFRKELRVDCDAELVFLIPEAVHDAQQAAIAAAEKYLDRACYIELGECPNRPNRFTKPETCGECNGLGKLVMALAQLRAVKEAE